jgi:hypothetical protein
MAGKRSSVHGPAFTICEHKTFFIQIQRYRFLDRSRVARWVPQSSLLPLPLAHSHRLNDCSEKNASGAAPNNDFRDELAQGQVPYATREFKFFCHILFLHTLSYLLLFRCCVLLSKMPKITQFCIKLFLYTVK